MTPLELLAVGVIVVFVLCIGEELGYWRGRRDEQAKPVEKCVWADTGDSASWQSSCGKHFEFNEGGPVENGMKFCYSCGKPLEEIPARFDEWGDPITDDDEEES